jgi:hypothetical protein
LEILDLAPPRLGAVAVGIHVVDDSGTRILAGPFGSEAAALDWIRRTHPLRAAAARRAERDAGGASRA